MSHSHRIHNSCISNPYDFARGRLFDAQTQLCMVVEVLQLADKHNETLYCLGNLAKLVDRVVFDLSEVLQDFDSTSEK